MKKLLLIAPALVALTLTACGGSSSGDGGTGTQSSVAASSTTPGGQRGFMNDEVRACLQQQGVDLPERPQGADDQPPEGGAPAGGFGGSDADRQKLQDAMKACGVELPARGQGGGFQRPDANDADDRKRVNDYVACVRRNGFDLPDPDFSGDGPIFDPEEVDQSDKAFQAASAKCQDKLRPSTTSASR